MSSLSEVAAVIRRRNIEGTSDVEFREQLTSVLAALSEEDLGKVEALLRMAEKEPTEEGESPTD